jgi:hypothetical protein
MPDTTGSPKKALAGEAEKLARTITPRDPSTLAAAHEADVANVARLLTDRPDLRRKLVARAPAAKADGLSGEQVLLTARLHTSSEESLSSSARLQTELDRYLKDSGMF